MEVHNKNNKIWGSDDVNSFLAFKNKAQLVKVKTEDSAVENPEEKSMEQTIAEDNRISDIDVSTNFL